MSDFLRVDSSSNRLFLVRAGVEYPWKELQKAIKAGFPDFVIVEESFWDYQKLWLPDDQKAFLVAFKGGSCSIDFPAFPQVKNAEELDFLFRAMSSYGDYFSHPGEVDKGTLPPTRYFQTNELICTLQCSPGSNPARFDPRQVAVDNKEGVFKYVTLNAGYLDLSGHRFSIKSPLDYRKDNRELYLLLPPLDQESIIKIETYLDLFLLNRKVEYPEDCITLLEKNERHSAITDDNLLEVRLIEGVAPEQGRDSSFEIQFHLDHEEAERGNFYEVKQYIAVKKGDVLAIKRDAFEGKEGKDIFGNILPVEKGKDYPVKVQGPIEQTREGDRIFYRASSPGLLVPGQNSLVLKEVFQVSSNVDFRTGNIEFEKTVEIMGDVKAGFSVKSGGDIIIRGCVENGAFIKSEGESLLLGGVFGEKTVIETKGSLRAAFIQDATVYSQSDVSVEKSLRGGHIYCLGFLKVEGKGLQSTNLGAVFGGLYSSFRGIHIHSMGSESTESNFTLGHHWLIGKQLQEVSKNQATLEREQLALMNELPRELLSKEGLAKVVSLPPEKIEKLKKNLLLMKKISGMRDENQRLIEQYTQGEYAEENQSLEIIVENHLLGTNHFTIGKVENSMTFIDIGKQRIALHFDRIITEPL